MYNNEKSCFQHHPPMGAQGVKCNNSISYIYIFSNEQARKKKELKAKKQ